MSNKKLFLLVIDDDKLIHAVLSRFLSRYEYKYDLEANGLDGIEKIKKENYDLVFLDTIMPKINGLETLKIVKEIKPILPVVIMSSSAQVLLEEEIKKLHTYRLLHKPFEIKELAEIMEGILKQKFPTPEWILIGLRP